MRNSLYCLQLAVIEEEEKISKQMYLVIIFTATIATGICTHYLCKHLGLKLGIVDQPDNYRKVHKTAIPLTGGYSIFFSVFILISCCYFFDFPEGILKSHSKALLVFAGGAIITLAMGALDDIKDIRPKWKILFQIAAASLVYWAGFGITTISLPYIGIVHFELLSYPITVIWFLGCMNAINLLDGLDGLAGGVGFFASLTIMMSSIQQGSTLGACLGAIVAASIFAFLIFNFNPASVFLGDAGSMLIGFFVACMALITSSKSDALLALAIPFIAIGLPIFDTLAAIIRRWSRRVPISSADRKHIHHVLLEKGFSQKKVVLILYLVCLVLGGSSLLLSYGRDTAAISLLGALGIICYLYARRNGVIDIEQVQERIKMDRFEKRRGARAAVEVEKALHQFEKSQSLSQLWDYLSPALEALELDHSELSVELNSTSRTIDWKSEQYEKNHSQDLTHLDEWELTLKLFDGDTAFGHFKIAKISKDMPIRDVCYQVNKLRHGLAQQLNMINLKHTQANLKIDL